MDVNSFIGQLRAQTAAPATKSFKANSRVLEKISLNYEGNFGRYMVLPMNSVVLDYPFIKMDGTREICVPRRNVAQDGTESTYTAWIKLLPKDAYKFLDINGRITSSLTAADEQLLSEAYIVFDQLYNEIDAKNNQQSVTTRNLMRKRNYTIFNAYCCNFWANNKSGNPRDPQRSKFCGLFVATAKGFMNAVEENISSNNIVGDGGYGWLEQIYGRQQNNRTGYMMFNIGRSRDSVGYSVTVDHRFDCGSSLSGYSITDEEAEMMQNPVLNFLGWQAGHEDDELPVANRRLFNTVLIQEAIDYMTKQLAGVRSAKESGTSVEEAIKATSESVALENNTSYIPKNTTNDPMLKTNNVTPGGISQEEVMTRNNSPFQTPAAAKMDPVTGAPVSNDNGSVGFNGFGGGFAGSGSSSSTGHFQQPDFTKFGSGNNPKPNENGEGDLPF